MIHFSFPPLSFLLKTLNPKGHLRKSERLVPRHVDDPIFNTSWMFENFYHDLVLLENQIPWFVLKCLFNLTALDYEQLQEPDFLIILVLGFFSRVMRMTVPGEFKSRGREIKHVLDLLHRTILSSSEDIRSASTHNRQTGTWSLKLESTDRNLELFPPVTDLLQASVKFEKGTPDNILNIKFEKNKGVFQVPPIAIQGNSESLAIRGNSESLFRNLIAYEKCNLIAYEQCHFIEYEYEQCARHCVNKFTSYAVFLDCLINTSRDADLLCNEGILDHSMRTEDMSILFNGLYKDTLVYGFHYGGLAKEVNEYYKYRWPRWRPEYYKSRWPRWRAILKRDYFNSPWSICSFGAAILILVFTFLQTLFTILTS